MLSLDENQLSDITYLQFYIVGRCLTAEITEYLIFCDQVDSFSPTRFFVDASLRFLDDFKRNRQVHSFGGVEQVHHVDPLDIPAHAMIIMPADHLVLLAVRFSLNAVVNDQHTIIRLALANRGFYKLL